MSRSGRGRTRAEPRAASLVVLAAFGLGIGPATVVQPCPRHPMSSAIAAPVDIRVAADPATGHGRAVPSSHRSSVSFAHAHRDGRATDADPGGGSRTSHPDGPCDCLGLCHANYAPESSFAATRAFAAGRAVARRAAEPVQLVARHPARYLRPFAQPPPA